MSFEHVLLTRLNVRLGAGQAAPPDEWLAARLTLFRDFCLASVERQKRRPHHWLVFCDARTPESRRDDIEKLSADGAFRPVWLDGPFDAVAASRAVTAAGAGRAEHLITSRLDCDDALAPHFTETVQRQFAPGREPYFVNLALGYQMSAGRFYLRPYLANPFISLVERRSPGCPWDTVYCRPHHLVTDQRLVQVRSRPAWLQVIHGGNLANQVRGFRVPGRGPAHAFSVPAGYLCDDESLIAVAADQMATGARFVAGSLRDPQALRRLRNVITRRQERGGVPRQ